MNANESSRPLVVALGHRFPDVDIERDLLRGRAQLVDANTYPQQELPELLTRANFVLLGTQYALTRAQLESMPNLQVVIRYGVGADNVDVSQATARNIAVGNIPDYCIEEVGTHVVSLVLLINRGLLKAIEATKRGAWGSSALPSLRRPSSARAAIIGFGRIGRHVATALKSLGFQVMVADPFLPTEAITERGFEPVTVEGAFARADYISLHLPLSDETRRIVSGPLLNRMKSTAWIINTSRGEIIDESALAGALQRGQLAGAALDVLTQEPPPKDHPLLAFDNVIITPHSAWYSREAIRELRTRAAQNVISFMNGDGLTNILNPTSNSLDLPQELQRNTP